MPRSPSSRKGICGLCGLAVYRSLFTERCCRSSSEFNRIEESCKLGQDRRKGQITKDLAPISNSSAPHWSLVLGHWELACHAPVDRKHLPSHVAGGGAGEKEHAGGHILGQAQPLGGNPLLGFLHDHLAQHFRHVALNETGA